jgi:hypothetical protein
MAGKEFGRREFLKLGTTIILGAVLAACTPEGQAQETRPAVTQTVDSPESTLTNEEILELVTKPLTPTPTEENTATPESTATPEATATPATPEFPSDLVFDPSEQFNRGEFAFIDWGGGYRTIATNIKIRTQDVHYNEPFTMLNGRYYVQAWADAWFQEEDNTGHHVSIPLVVFDTENYMSWQFINPFIIDWSQSESETKDIFKKIYTGPWSENDFAPLQEEKMCFSESGNRTCTNAAAWMAIGAIPVGDINSDFYQINIEPNINFWRDLIKDIYTQEQIENFHQTLDPTLLKLNEPDLPINFFIPLRIDN